MQSQKDHPSQMMRLRDTAFDAASVAIRDARKRHAGAHQHRALHRVTATPYLIMQALLLPIVFCGVLLYAEPYVMSFWRDCIIFWLSRLDVPLHVHQQASTIDGLHFEWASGAAGYYMPSFTVMLGSALVTLLVFVFTTSMQSKNLPLKYLVRIVCVVQCIALLFFWFAPSQFPYTIPDHMRDIISMGYMLMLAIPVMLAIGYYLLHSSLPIKVIHTVFILSYFLLMIPHKVVLHTLILYKMSLLYMPVLYICLGAVFDVLLFVALYSWAVSMLPPHATD